MKHGICHIALIALRATPNETAEMVTQLLFGDAYKVIEEQEKWLKIETYDCNYIGWLDKKVFNPIHADDVDTYLSSKKYIVDNFLLFIQNFNTKISFPIFIGSSFPYPQGEMLILGDAVFNVTLPTFSDVIIEPPQKQLIRFLSTYLGAPYLWGGRSPAGIDCSGLVQIAYKYVGIMLPRDASQQVEIGKTIDFIHEAQAGDVAFFENEEKQIIHTGIICESETIVHASGSVRIDKLDQTGIFNQKENKHTHFLRIIKRYL